MATGGRKIELATAYISIVPSTGDIKPGIRKELREAQLEADRNPVNIKTKTDSSSLKTTTNILKDLGKTTAGVSAVGAAVAAIGGAAGLSAGAMGVMTSSMAVFGSAAAAGLATAKVGLNGVSDAFKALSSGDVDKINAAMAKLAPNAQSFALAMQGIKPQFEALQQAVQNDLFAGLDKSFTNLANTLIPSVRIGMEQVATSMNGATNSMANFLASTQAQESIRSVFSGTADLINQSEVGVQNLTGSILNLGNVVGPAMGPIGQSLGGIAANLGNTINSLIDTGQMATLFQTLNSVLQSAGPLLGSLVTSLVQLANTAGPGITALFDALGPALQNIAGPLGSLGAVFGQALAGVLPTLSQLIAALANGLQPVLPILGQLLTALGQALIPLVGPLSQVTQIVGTALTGAIQALAPAVAPLGTAFAAMLQAVAPIVPLIAQLASTVIQALAPALTTVFQAFAPVIQQLVAALQPAIVALAPVLSQVAGILGQALAQALTAIAPVLPALVTNFAAFLQAISPLLPLITSLATGALVLLIQGFTQIVGVVQSVAGFIRDNSTAFGALAAVIGGALMPVATVWTALVIKNLALMALQKGAAIAAAVATNGMAIAQRALNLAMSLNPIGIIIAAIAALVVGVIYAYTHFQTFRTIVQDAWNGIKVVVGAVWNGFLKPIFDAIGTAIGFVIDHWKLFALGFSVVLGPVAVVAAAIFLFRDQLMGAFTAIGNAATWLWHGAIEVAWNGIAAAVNWLWHSVIEPAFNGIGNVITWVYNTLIKPIFDAFKDYINNITIPAVMWLWHNVIEPAWNGIGAVISFVWTSIIKRTWDALTGALSAIGAAFQWVWNNVINPTWTTLGNGIKWVNDHVIQPVWDAIQTGLGVVKTAFQDAVGFIGKMWDGIKKVVAAPVQFVLHTVLNDGIFKAWNAVAGFLHISPNNLHADEIPGYATGGYVSGPGGATDDKIPAMLSNGEFVLTAATVNRIGVDNLNRINGGGSADGMARIAGMPAMAAGGEVTQSLVNAHEFARSMDGKAYLMGGAAPGPTDCSGFMSAIANVVLGGPGSGRYWSTTAFPASQGGDVNAGGQHWVGGLSQGFSIGVIGGADSGGANGHTAGTLSAAGKYGTMNVEAGGSHGNVAYGGAAVGADAGEFPTQYHLPIMDGKFESGGKGGGGGGLFGWLRDKAAKLFTIPVKAIKALVDKFVAPLGQVGQLASGFYDKFADETIKFVSGKAGDEDSSAGQPGTGPVQDQAKQAFARYGWGDGDEWAAASWIIDHESGWNPNATNPSSGAYGLPQFLGSTKDQYLPDNSSNPGVQADAMARYIRDRYGDPKAAQAFWKAHNYYDSGGIFPDGTIGINASGKPEAVLTNDQWKMFAKFIELLMGLKAAPAPATAANNQPANPSTTDPSQSPTASASPGVTPQESAKPMTAQDIQGKIGDIGSSFASANFDQFMSDLGGSTSGGALEELVKAVQSTVVQQITAKLTQQATASMSFIGR